MLYIMQIALFGIYLAVLLFVFVYIAIVIMHIGEFREYSLYLAVVLRVYLILIVLIALFGAYKVLTGKYVAPKKSPTHQIQKLDF
jgi:Na+/glutamate symporter